MAVEYDEPDAQGLQGCPRHPYVPRFDATRAGCPACADTPPSAAVASPGPGELACAEAERRGLPDALYVETRFWTSWQFMERRAEQCATRADKLFDDGAISEAVRMEAAAAKWADSATKAGKIASASVFERERQAGLDRRARILDKPKTEGVH